MKTYFHEVLEVCKQGGVIMWLMLFLCVILYATLTSFALGIHGLKKDFEELRVKLLGVQGHELLADEVSIFELSRLAWVRRRVPVLSSLIALAPLSGLFGTVSGMLVTFAGMASQSSLKPIDSISNGISQALITTQIGLLIATPAAIVFAMLKSQFDHARSEFERLSSQRSADLFSQLEGVDQSVTGKTPTSPFTC